ncbi:fluoride efflux transporter CrcB [Roseicella aerolata]|uniref:Fluoride-specific ion channel FluC n=1 Tax=Roseicella aerolata TaxID=2883479 RepID=A0A9X1IGZ5_9PROT|nr:fluoride efflux transporter CrcB [Roseicella aerolata]MCB4824382.1 fluoride efflux transporter CrcB [Roseicella aerolata]
MTTLTFGQLLLVAAGGALGSVLRFLVSTLSAQAFGAAFPWGTLLVNLLGSAAIGLLGGLGIGGAWRLLLVTGLLGGFTTFSAFSLETGLLWQRHWSLALLYVAASLALGLAGFAICYALARRMGGMG